MTAPSLLKPTSKKNSKASSVSYEAALNYLDELELFGMKLGLNNMSAVCKILHDPQFSYRTIHVTGTNGKGSVTAICGSILKEAGYRVGTYTSPHLQTVRERIRINGEFISEDDFARTLSIVKEAADKLKDERMTITYFEFMTAMSFLYFKEKKCDFAVIEVGMGGRLDATNVLKPDVAVITNVDVEHSKYLGNTKEKIVYEKAGIIKERITVVTSEEDAKIRERILQMCNRKKASLIFVSEAYEGAMPLAGEHQKKNAATAIAAVKSIKNVEISRADVEKGVAKTQWPGRLEAMQENPLVIVDASHNPAGMETTADYVRSLGRELILVLGISKDKNAEKITEAISPLAKRVIITSAKHRGYDCETLLEITKPHNKNAEIVADVKAAVKRAVELAKEEAVLVTGSLFVAGEARNVWFQTRR